MDLTHAELEALYSIVQKGLNDSSRALSSMTTGGIQLQDPRLQFLSLAVVPNIAGGPEKVVVAVYLGIEGDLNGHLMLLFTQESGLRVVDMLMEMPPGSTRQLDELAVSGLAELGNICCSSFLNALSDRTGLTIVPTTPVVVVDMAGAILESVVTELYLNGDEVLVVETGFNGEIPGHYLLMPDQDSMARLVAALEEIE
ncbi:MAG TPA: chemotaxis protein CheX [Symbiobacteriaceae bacterium]|nr:chemotaxis protein CheX [Symbiobacteriaceae bacterium]